ncbi:MAG TPA: VOC family protein [Mycobacteriales bacterium]|jgi:hypothetical protein|nr:VOC family protein [Mycobacteriales bacterium]
MAYKFQVTFDCADPAALARWWADALGYVVQPPPEGYADWPSFAREMGIPESEFDSRSAAIDPEGAGPRLFFQKVPEPKAVKNRVHLDVNVGRDKVEAEVERLVANGATVVERVDQGFERWVVLSDPEGNELCLQ